MAKKELPKAQLGGLVKAYQGAKAGFKLASKIKTRAKNIKAIGVAKAKRTQKAAETRAANKAANAKPASNTKKVIPKPKTETPSPTPKGKEPIVKSKARLAVENVAGNLIGGVTFGTGNVVKKALKNRIVQSGLSGGGAAYVINKIAEGKRPVKIKKK